MPEATLGIIGLNAAYVLLAVLLLSLNLRSRWHWLVKGCAIVLTTLFYLVAYLAIPPMLGWPIQKEPPRHFHLVAAHIEQPDKRLQSEGRVYLWLTPALETATAPPPRAYSLPYTQLLHERVVTATQKLHRGMPQIGEFRDPEGENPVGKVEDPSRAGRMSAAIEFYDLPDPLFPEVK